jgi:hypothetical protein
MEKRGDLVTRIASDILAAARAKGVTIKDWYLDDKDYEEYRKIAQQRGQPKMKICGANIHRKVKQD